MLFYDNMLYVYIYIYMYMLLLGGLHGAPTLPEPSGCGMNIDDLLGGLAQFSEGRLGSSIPFGYTGYTVVNCSSRGDQVLC